MPRTTGVATRLFLW